jgi:hypothetical protein
LIGNKICYIGGDLLTPNNHTIDGTSIDIGTLPDLIPGAVAANKNDSLFSRDLVPASDDVLTKLRPSPV